MLWCVSEIAYSPILSFSHHYSFLFLNKFQTQQSIHTVAKDVINHIIHHQQLMVRRRFVPVYYIWWWLSAGACCTAYLPLSTWVLLAQILGIFQTVPPVKQPHLYAFHNMICYLPSNAMPFITSCFSFKQCCCCIPLLFPFKSSQKTVVSWSVGYHLVLRGF